MLGVAVGQIHHTQVRRTGRAGTHRGLEHRIVGCTDCHHTGCHRIGVAGCRRTEVGEDPADSLHILAAGVVGSHTGHGSGSDSRKGPTWYARYDIICFEL